MSVRPVTNWMDWWTEWTDGSFSVSVCPSVHQTVAKMDEKLPFSDRKMDGREYQTFLIFPSVHFSAENRHFPSMFATVWWTDWWTGWTDGTGKWSVRPLHSFLRPLCDGWNGRADVVGNGFCPSVSQNWTSPFLFGWFLWMDGRWWRQPLIHKLLDIYCILQY